MGPRDPEDFYVFDDDEEFTIDTADFDEFEDFFTDWSDSLPGSFTEEYSE